MKFIELKNINYWYPNKTEKALEDIELSIKKGDMLLLTGASGSGKSTLGKLIAGTVPQFYGGTLSGQMFMEDKDLNSIDRRKRAETITMVFQDPEKQLVMNKVHREIALGLESLAVEPKEILRRVWEAMEFIGISHLAERDISSLSGGEKQKVSIASALAYLPHCIILDEPTSQLDPSAAEDIINIITKINEELGITIIVIEQRLEKWFQNCDRLLVMEKGRIVYNGDKEDFYEEGSDKFIPISLRLSKKIGVKTMPLTAKTIRNRLEVTNLNIQSNIHKNNIGKPCIIARGIYSGYDGKRVLKDVELEIKEGDFACILGSNGAGKSTLLKTICGLLKYEGSLKLFGKEVKKISSKEMAATVAYVSQNPNDYISKDSVYEEIAFTLDNFKINHENRIEDILNKLGLIDLKDRNPRDLSGGEKQRLAIASVLVMNSKILILDEPTRGMDIENKKKLGALLKKLSEEGTTIIMVTHDIDFSAKYCNNFLLMFDGKIAASGDISSVMKNNIFFTTTINKIFRGIREDVYNLEQIGE